MIGALPSVRTQGTVLVGAIAVAVVIGWNWGGVFGGLVVLAFSPGRV
jgi:hypothetical protein